MVATDLNTQSYAAGNPQNFKDPYGLGAIYISFPEYPITIPGMKRRLPLGHAAVVALNEETGATKYFEYGRYGGDFGKVEVRQIPDVIMGDDGKPTPESLQNLYSYISETLGKGTRVVPVYYSSASYRKVVAFARNRMTDPRRDPYSWNPFHENTCMTFAREAIRAGHQ